MTSKWILTILSIGFGLIGAIIVEGVTFVNGANTPVATINVQTGKLDISATNQVQFQGPVTFNQMPVFMNALTSVSTANTVTSIGSYAQVTINSSLKLSTAANSTCGAGDAGKLYYNGTAITYCDGSAWKQFASSKGEMLTIGEIYGTNGAGSGYVHYVSDTEVYLITTWQNGSAYTPRVYKWDGTTLTGVGNASGAIFPTGTNAHSNWIMEGSHPFSYVSPNDMYITWTISSPANSFVVYKWNGTSWSHLGSKVFNNGNYPSVRAVNANEVYVIYRTPSPQNGVVEKWNGSSWSQIGTMSGNNFWYPSLYVNNANDMIAIGGNNADYIDIYKWNGTTWTELTTGTFPENAPAFVSPTKIINSTTIYAGHKGIYQFVPGSGTWTQIGTGPLNANGYPLDIALNSNGELYVLWQFSQKTSLYKWNGATWKDYGQLHMGNSDTDNSNLAAGTNGDLYLTVEINNKSHQLIRLKNY